MATSAASVARSRRRRAGPSRKRTGVGTSGDRLRPRAISRGQLDGLAGAPWACAGVHRDGAWNRPSAKRCAASASRLWRRRRVAGQGREARRSACAHARGRSRHALGRSGRVRARAQQRVGVPDAGLRPALKQALSAAPADAGDHRLVEEPPTPGSPCCAAPGCSSESPAWRSRERSVSPLETENDTSEAEPQRANRELRAGPTGTPGRFAGSRGLGRYKPEGMRWLTHRPMCS
jgi:hypothetical protein